MWSGLLVVFLLGPGHRRGYLRMACKPARLHKNLYKESYVFCQSFGSNFRRRSLPEIVATGLCERASVKSGGVARVVGGVVVVAAVVVFLWVVLSLVLLVLLFLLFCFVFSFV